MQINALAYAIASIALILARLPSAIAEEGYIGAFLGPSFGNQNVSLRPTYGAHAGVRIRPDFSLAIYGTHEVLGYNLMTPVKGAYVAGSDQATIVLLEGNWSPIDSQPFFIGAKAGLGIVSFGYSSPNGENFTTQPTQRKLTLGLATGYRYSINTNWAVTSEINFISVALSQSSLNFVNILLGINYNL